MNYKETVDNLRELVYTWENIQLICDYIILWAVLSGASDIHLEPLSNFVRLRYRIDGELKRNFRIPKLSSCRNCSKI